MQLVGVSHPRQRLGAYLGDGGRIQGAELARLLGRNPAPVANRLGTALLQWRVIQERVRPRVDDLLREGRRFAQVARHQLHRAAFHVSQQRLELGHVHRLGQAVADRLGHQGVIRHFAVAAEVFLTGKLVGEYQGQQVFRLHPLQVGRHPLAAALADDRQGAGGVPAPAGLEHWRIQQRLHQHAAHAAMLQVAPYVGQRKAVGLAQRQHQGVFVGRRLQLEVEVAAEALAQRQPPGAVETTAARGVNHDVHVAGLIEEAFDYRRGVGGHRAEGVHAGVQVVHHLLRRRGRQPHLRHQPAARRGRALGLDQPPDAGPQTGHRLGQLVAAARRLSQPERQRGRLGAGIHYPHHPGLDLDDFPRLVAEQEDVAGDAFHGEVFVDAADEQVLRVHAYLIVEVVGNRAAVGQGDQAGAAAPAQAPADAVMVQVGGAPPARGGEALGQHAHHGVELLAGQIAVGERAPADGEQRLGRPLLRTHLGHDLLRQHVQRLRRHADAVQLSRLRRGQQRRALHQFVAGKGKQAALGGAGDMVPGAADALQERHDRLGRPELAHQVHHADVDAELQGRGRDDDPQVAGLQSLLGVQPLLARQAAVVRGDLLLSQQGAQGVAHALREAARVDEDQGGAVIQDQLRQALVQLVPHLVRHHRLQRRSGHLQRHVHGAAMPAVDDAAGRRLPGRRRFAAHPGQEGSGRSDGALRSRQADAGDRRFGEGIQALQAQRQMRAALGAQNGVDLVDDHRAGGGQQTAPAGAGEQQIERFRGSHHDVRRALGHGGAGGRRRVAGAQAGADFRGAAGRSPQALPDPLQRGLQIALDVVAERLEGRNVDHPGCVRQGAGGGLPHQVVDGAQERRQRLAGAGGRRDQGVAARLDGGPRGALRR